MAHVAREARSVAIDTDLVRELGDIVGGEQVLTDADLTERYRRDWTNRFQASEATVVRPANATEIAAIVEVCRRRQVAIVPQGGNTGLVAGSVPLSGELVVSTERLSRVDTSDAHLGALTVEAGARLADVQRAAIDNGWVYGVDIASRDSATLGGTIATNACGIRVLGNGNTRRQVEGIEMVTGTGEIISSLGATLRDNTGYHLPSLITGSEGTLGIVTRARLRLVPQLRQRTTALMRFAEVSDAADAAEALRGVLPSIESIEVFFAPGLELVCSAFGFPPPFSDTAGGYVLAEAAGNHDPTAALGEAVESLAGISDVAVAEDSGGRERLWRLRELHTEAISTVGVPHKLDVAVPPGALATLVNRVSRVVAEVDPDAKVWLFGHGGESSMHVNVTGPAVDDDAVDDAVLGLVASLGGSISAEHGIGRAKLGWIDLAHDAATLATLARLKGAFDPAGIMNPAVLIPPAL